MRHLLETDVLPMNRPTLDQYLNMFSFDRLETMLSAVDREPYDQDEELIARFAPYVKSEEDRIAANLKSVAYEIDEQDTLALVTGPGRIERVRL